jgi:hypothetical protein
VSTVASTTKKSVVMLQHDDDGIVTVVPTNQDRFSLSIKQAVRELRLANQIDDFRQQLDLLMKVLGSWLGQRSDVSDAYLTLRNGKLAFVVIRAESRYNSEFEDDISDLDIDIAEDPLLQLVRVHSLALPPADETAVDTFLDSRFTIRFSHAK